MLLAAAQVKQGPLDRITAQHAGDCHAQGFWLNTKAQAGWRARKATFLNQACGEQKTATALLLSPAQASLQSPLFPGLKNPPLAGVDLDTDASPVQQLGQEKASLNVTGRTGQVDVVGNGPLTSKGHGQALLECLARMDGSGSPSQVTG